MQSLYYLYILHIFYVYIHIYIYTCIGRGFLRTQKFYYRETIGFGGSNSVIWSAIREKATYMGYHRIGFWWLQSSEICNLFKHRIKLLCWNWPEPSTFWHRSDWISMRRVSTELSDFFRTTQSPVITGFCHLFPFQGSLLGAARAGKPGAWGKLKPQLDQLGDHPGWKNKSEANGVEDMGTSSK